MQKLGLNEIREKYLRFFQSKGHLRLPSFSLVPENDKSLLLIPAGMAPLKPFFTGEQTPPRTRITTCQKCIRTNDIENVGVTARHLTFFEMLGNFSFGDYFKHEACPWAWEFVTKVLEMPADRLYVSIYEEDDEAFDIWTREVGVEPSHVFRMGKADNFWEIGTGAGPCGPCSEIYFDRGEKYACGPDCHPGCDCDRFVEFWNLVFTQFENDGHDHYKPLAKRNIDTGMGLERIACIMQQVDSLFEIDTMTAITDRVCALAGVARGTDSRTDVSLRIITDHIRSTVMLICDGVLPGNEGRGYVLRRLLRRAARHGKLLGIEGPFLTELSKTVFEVSGEAYPELLRKQDYIRQVIALEEQRFDRTIDAGLRILADLTASMKAAGRTAMDGADAFRLYDTFGFPVDLTVEILAEQGLSVDRPAFDALMQEQRERARRDRRRAGSLGWEGSESALEGVPETVFTGYTGTEGAGAVAAILAGDEMPSALAAGAEAAVVLTSTSFYAESGGQVADTGVIRVPGTDAVFEVRDVQKTPEHQFLHSGVLKSGTLRVGDEVRTEVDAERRHAIMRAHSATHLLQAALRGALGTHVEQAGSYVEPDRFRFDFSHFAPMTEAELTAVEDRVNEKILEGIPGTTREMPIEEARKMGAMALFGEKYGDVVRVVSFGDYSVEFCGGTHLDNTAKAGLCRLTGESSVAAGVRRIEGVTGAGVLDMLREYRQTVGEAAAELKTNPQELVRRARQITAELREAHRELETAQAKLARGTAAELLSKAREVDGLKLVTAVLPDMAPDRLRGLSDMLRDLDGGAVALLASVEGEKVSFCVSCGRDAVARGAHAGNLARLAAKTTGGGGGGRPDGATAGGKDPAKLAQALSEAEGNLKAMLK